MDAKERKLRTRVRLDDLPGNAGQACDLLKAIANESRLMVLCKLVDGEASVGELQDAVGLNQSAMSQHLALLRQNRLVARTRRGQYIYYRIVSEDALAIMKTLHARFCGKQPSRGKG